MTSQVVDVGGTRVHYLRAGDDVGGTTHLLVHPMATGSWSWMDVIGPLSAHGLVLAPDLPGSGRTRPLSPRTATIDENARFLKAFTSAIGLEHVVVHGHSMGGLVGSVFAGRAPDRVERLVLTSAPLPGLPDPPPFPGLWRLGLEAGRPVARVLVGAGLRLKAGAWRLWVEDPPADGIGEAATRLGTDIARISPELRTLAADEIEAMRLSWRVAGAVDALTAALRALTVDEAAVRASLDRISAPTLLLWGADDRVIPQRLIDEVEIAHPTWTSRVVPGVGHVMPWEAPATYVELVTSPR